MRTPKEAVALIKEFEGLRTDAYQCQAGVWTIGYGHTKGVRKGQNCTPAEAEAILLEDLAEFEVEVDRLVTADVPDIQLGACVSLAFNIGLGGFEKSSLLKAINAGKPVDALWMQWSHYTDPATKASLVSDGLARRRRAELALFHSAGEQTAPPAGAVVTQAPPAKPLAKSVTVWGTITAMLAGVEAYADQGVQWIMTLASSLTTDWPPVRMVLESAGANGKAMGLGALIFCGFLVMSRRAKAQIEGL